jgi:D-xylose transport system substrate-binding protein
MRAGQTPPASLVNGSTQDSTNNSAVPSSLLTPVWVTSANLQSTVVADGAVKVSDLCISSLASACTTAGVK